MISLDKEPIIGKQLGCEGSKNKMRGHIATTMDTLLLTAIQAATMCGRSLRTFRSWDAAGKIPRPIRIGRSTLWRAEELRAWVAAGCPRRRDWEDRQSAQ